MPRLVAGPPGETVELQDISNGYWFEITQGGLDGIFDVRGSDTIIPGKDGREVRSRTADSMTVVLHGMVFGTPGGAGVSGSYSARMAELKDVGFYPVTDPIPLTIHPDAVGVGGRVGAGETATLNVRFLRIVGPPAVGDQVRQFDIELECVDSPPEWVIEAS